MGGDGTARDVYDAIDSRAPVVGVPAGVKVFSSVFAVSARAAADMVQNRPNLAIMRTMDKALSLAGARVGYVLAGKSFLEALSSFYAFLPQCSLHVAIEALTNPGYIKRNIHIVIEERKRVMRTLDKLGVRLFPSNTNFFL